MRTRRRTLNIKWLGRVRKEEGLKSVGEESKLLQKILMRKETVEGQLKREEGEVEEKT